MSKRIVVVARCAIEDCEIVERGSDVGMVRPQGLFAARQRALQQRFGLAISTLRPENDAKMVTNSRHIHVIGAHGAFQRPNPRPPWRQITAVKEGLQVLVTQGRIDPGKDVLLERILEELSEELPGFFAASRLSQAARPLVGRAVGEARARFQSVEGISQGQADPFEHPAAKLRCDCG